ncbi:MAG TPA: DUF732 domain-containing protein [Acidimicrobiales bacterium]|nr:DUF732 domain-containing protein [Acidimicrobiales bacterium]
MTARRRRLRSLAIGLAASVVAVGCGGPPPAPSAADAAFLSAVHTGAPDIASYRSDAALVRLGHAACDGFRSGVSYTTLADRLALLQGSHTLPSDDLGTVITAAVQAYCPQYAGKVA